jgi:hypothetical protein
MSFLNAATGDVAEKKLYHGITEVEVIGFNPNKANIAKIYEMEESDVKEPSYVTPEYTRLDCFVKKAEPKIISKISFFVSNKEVKGSLSDKYQFINNKGQSCWSTSLEALKMDSNLDWFDKSDIRIAKEGEVKLYSFLVALFNVDVKNKQNNLKLESWDKIVKGDVSELNKYIQHFKINHQYNSVKVLFGIKDGKYQDLYSEVFARKSQNNYSYLMKAATAEKGGFKSYFGNSPVFQEFDLNKVEEMTTLNDSFTSIKQEDEFIFKKPEETPWKEPVTDINPFESVASNNNSEDLFS